MSLVAHAKKEFRAVGWLDEPVEESQQWIMNNILELMEVFSKQGHSGSSAPYVLNLFNDLASFKIIAPLTGKDSEWNEVDEDGLLQNNRDSRIFKGKDGEVYNIDGYVFVEPDGSSYTSGKSRKKVIFPATQKDLEPEYVNVEKEEGE